MPPTYRLPSSTRMSQGALKLRGLQTFSCRFPLSGPQLSGYIFPHFGSQVANSRVLLSFLPLLPPQLLLCCHSLRSSNLLLHTHEDGCYQNPEITGAGKAVVEELETVCFAGWECEVAQPVWKIWQFLKKLNIELPYDPAIPLRSVTPKESKAGSRRGICTPVFMAVLFIIAQGWKQPRWPRTDEWINEVWYIQKMEHYLALKRNELLRDAWVA